MHVLFIKMSSMGDVIHVLPALTDAAKAHPAIRFDWVVEEGFAEIKLTEDVKEQRRSYAKRSDAAKKLK